MNETRNIAVLFDFDGVVMDTESQYTIFWDKVGKEYLDYDNFGERIKGQTLELIYEGYFVDMPLQQEDITAALDLFEQQMTYNYIPGVKEFAADLRHHGVKTAIVTSSNMKKMEMVCRVRPELPELFDRTLTAELFTRSKPAPDCFLLGMEIFGTTPETTYVFEDSFNGLKSGMASGATVIGLTTTNPAEAIKDLSHHVIDDFRGMSFDRLVNRMTYVRRD